MSASLHQHLSCPKKKRISLQVQWLGLLQGPWVRSLCRELRSASPEVRPEVQKKKDCPSNSHLKKSHPEVPSFENTSPCTSLFVLFSKTSETVGKTISTSYRSILSSNTAGLLPPTTLSRPCQGHQRPPSCKSRGCFLTHILLIHLAALDTVPLRNRFFSWL